MIVVLSGGVGAARLLRSLRLVHNPRDVVAVVNVGDDTIMHGLTICPDLDSIMYTLAGENNDVLGWGRRDESWRVMDELAQLGGESWFRLGDRDLAVHLYRTERLHRGFTKSDVTRELCDAFEIPERLIPISNETIETTFLTRNGRLQFQEYFVKFRHDIEVTGIEFSGSESATPSPGVLEALALADRIVIAPSNPLISVDPILAVAPLRDVLTKRRRDVVAISPLIAGSAIKGPADRLMREMGHDASCVGVARHYGSLVGTFIIDVVDSAREEEIRQLDMDVRITTTVMSDPQDAARLASVVLA